MSITSQAEPLAKIRSKQMMELLASGKRIDGRDLLAQREITLERGIIEKAEGSASVTLGNTRVLVGVKIEAGEPYPDTPNQGVLTVNAEFVPLAHEFFEPGPPNENSIELARIVDRGIRESKAVDLEKLVLTPGRLVYVVFVDIYILNHDGNLVDASEYAALAALQQAKLPKVEVGEDGEVKRTGEFEKLPVVDTPISVTVAEIDGKLLVDPNLEEENMAQAKVTMTLTKDNKLCAVQKSGAGTFAFNQILECFKIAREKSSEIRRKFFEE
ncbi:exosome complex protein Rrp42 [Candidatus Hecatella orcuttiae]|jgi:exosome complex component RRP42|uniref:exosome complex protein Rrp42 n=1 Tax=Candidatus Hecatella orcuttiae TaxID=1935119 RepID=UPI0028682107|nr:exosome complex protein Rrp42 [Candidatus Hecatella orcuttiae]